MYVYQHANIANHNLWPMHAAYAVHSPMNFVVVIVWVIFAHAPQNVTTEQGLQRKKANKSGIEDGSNF